MSGNSLFRFMVISLSLTALLLSGCGSSSSGGGSGPVSMSAITSPSADGNIQVAIGGVTVNSPPVVTFALSDESGQPLDPNAVLKDTTNRIRFVIAKLDATGNYTNYIVDSKGLPSYDGNGSSVKGTFATVSPGVYTYTFGADIKANGIYDATATHTVAIQIARNATKNGKAFQQISNPYINFRPDGGKVTATREVVSVSACNQCHGKLSAHGSRTEVALCVLCHNAGAALYTDVATGYKVSIDFKTMIHKIHLGENLPSGAYFQNSKFANFSTVTYPVFSSDYKANGVPMDCTKCHQKGTNTFGKTFGADVDKWKGAPTIANCTTCHDTTAFAGETTLTVDGVAGIAAVAHSGGSQADGSCSGCHNATGSDYDGAATISVPGVHAVWEKSTVNKGIVAKVLSATNVLAGKYPRVTFQVTDAKGNPITIDPGTPTTPASGAGNKIMVYQNAVSIHYAVKPKNGPDFLNTKPATDPSTSKLGTSNSTASVSVNNLAFAGTLVTVDASRGIYFANFSTAQTVTGNALGATAAQASSSLPNLSGDYANGAIIAFGVQATRSDISITHRGVSSVVGVIGNTGGVYDPAKSTLSSSSIIGPVTPAKFMANVYYDLSNGQPVFDAGSMRRQVVDNAKCIACHNIIVGGVGAFGGTPTLHGGGRPNAEACVLCHGPNKNESDFKFLIHRWHTGKDSTAVSRWKSSYQGVTYPNDRRRCNACHIVDNPALPASATFATRQDGGAPIAGGTLGANVDATIFAAGYNSTGVGTSTMPTTNRIPATTAACIACHDDTTGSVAGSSTGATGHAKANYGTGPNFSESCISCHADSIRKLDHQLPN